jgi:hypothetical protein
MILVVLVFLGLGAFCVGVFFCFANRAAGLIALLASALFFVGAAIVGALSDYRKGVARAERAPEQVPAAVA